MSPDPNDFAGEGKYKKFEDDRIKGRLYDQDKLSPEQSDKLNKLGESIPKVLIDGVEVGLVDFVPVILNDDNEVMVYLKPRPDKDMLIYATSDHKDSEAALIAFLPQISAFCKDNNIELMDIRENATHSIKIAKKHGFKP